MDSARFSGRGSDRRRSILVIRALLALSACHWGADATPNRDDNGLWARRTWLHEPHDDAEVDALIASLRARGITQFYPFLGPPGPDGAPGWRDGEVVRPADPAIAGAFLDRMRAKAPDIAVYPWTGGLLGRDVDLADRARLGAWIDHVIALPSAGVQINIEPMPEWDTYIDLLDAWKAKRGDRTLSVAAYPPTTPLHPYPDVHWSPAFLRKVCSAADDLVVMCYDTALTTPDAYTALVAEWTRALSALPPPDQGGCTVRIGVPDYEDVEGWHHPGAETLAAAIAGVRAGLGASPPANVRGIAIYASWTTDAADWATYDRDWRGRNPVDAGRIDAP